MPTLKLLVDAGDMKPGPAVGQQLGPLGINIGKVIQQVNQATQDFKGLKVPVELNVKKNKTFEIKVLSPPTFELLKKLLGIEKASGTAQKIKVANASIEQIISVAKTKYPSMLASDFKSAVKTVVGSCVSAGILIENKEAKQIIKDIDSGKYDSEISEQKTQTSAEKRKKLDAYFAEVQAKQEEILRKEQEEKETEEAKKAEVAAEATAKPGTEEEKKVATAEEREEAKTEEKKSKK